jgi:uncharacterized membrane protein YdbT with pleckstrin-like domain
MFCTKCGARNSIEAIYCQKCGTLLEAEEETRVAQRVKIQTNEAARKESDDGEERQIFCITPTLLFVKIGYGLAALGALFLVAFLSAFFQSVSVWVGIFLGFALFLIPAFYHLKQKLVRYTLTDAKIEIDEGFVSNTTRNVPLRTIQDVTIAATVPQRLLGFGDLIIDNASESGGKIVLKNINEPKKHAEALLRQMRKLNR